VNLSDEVELLTSYTRAEGQMPGLFGVGITRVESDIQSLQDLRGKTVCFPDPSSATGYLWPAYALQQVGIDADIVTSPDITPVISGNFPAVGVGVFNGDCDFGFVADVTWDRILPTLETVDMSQLRVVWESDRIPSGPFAANTIVPSELREQVKQLLIEKANKDYFVEAGLCEDVATCPHLAVSVWGFIETPDSFYDPVREVCNALELERCATKN
jgi:phosphonate transport system substrate-binding protein